MNCDLIDLKQETINCNEVNLENFFPFVSDGLPGYLLLPIVLSGLPTGYLLFVTHWRPQISHVRVITGMCMKILVLRKSELFQSI